MLDGAQAVGDDDGDALFGDPFDRLDDASFALSIQSAGGFVEDEDLRIDVEGAGDGDALALSSREIGSVLIEVGVDPSHLLDEVPGVGLFERLFDPLFVDLFAVGDVGGDGVVEDIDPLGDDGDGVAQALQTVVLKRDPVEVDRSLRGVVEAGDEIDDGAFASSAIADEGQFLPLFYAQVDAVERPFFPVMQVDVLKAQLLGFCHLLLPLGDDARLLIQEKEDSLRSGKRILEAVVDGADLFDGPVEHKKRRHEREETSHGHFAVDHLVTADDDHGHGSYGTHELHQGTGELGSFDGFHIDAKKIPVFFGEFFGFEGFGGSGFDDFDIVEDLGQSGGDVGSLFLRTVGELFEPFGDQTQRNYDQRHDHQSIKSQTGILIDRYADEPRCDQNLTEEVGKHGRDDVSDLVDIVDVAADEFPRMVAVEKVHIQRKNLLEHAISNATQNVFADVGGVVDLDIFAAPFHGIDEDDGIRK